MRLGTQKNPLRAPSQHVSRPTSSTNYHLTHVVTDSVTPPSRGQRRRRATEVSSDSTQARPMKRRRTARESPLLQMLNCSNTLLAPGTIEPAIIATTQPPPLPARKTAFDLLLQLDDCDQAGLTETQFQNLFVKCSNCRLFTTKSAFIDHHCRTLLPIAPQSTEIIDLTLDDD